MMTANIPKLVLHDIHKMQRASFIWGDDNETRVHAFKGDMVTRPKQFGGHCLGRLTKMNSTCLMKLSWEVRTSSKAL